MSSISIIGSGNVAKAIGTRAIAGGNRVEVIGRDREKARELAADLGGGATAAVLGAVPVGDLVVLAVPSAGAVPVVAQYGDALVGKVVIDVTNTSNVEATELTVPEGSSGAQEIANALPSGASVVKAFNTVFGHVLARGGELDVLLAGDDAEAKAQVSALVTSMGLRPLDAGGLPVARWLEGAGLLMISLARNGVGSFDFSLGVDIAD